MVGAVNNSEVYGSAFKNKPIILQTNEEVVAFLKGKKLKSSTLSEDTCTLSTNNSYRNHTRYEVLDEAKDKTYLDLEFLIRDETSCLKGSFDSESDIDFYNVTVPFNRTIQNNFGIDINMEMPEGSNYQLTLYDEYGNQVGIAKLSGENQKTLCIPNWDTKTLKYCIKVENEDGSSIQKGDNYKISFHVSNIEDTAGTDAVHKAYINCKQAYEDKTQCKKADYKEKNEIYEKCLAEYNRLLKEAETNYGKEVEKLQKKQYDELPTEKQYKGDKTVSQLLEKMANGEMINDAELEYVKIYANLLEAQKAQEQGTLKNESSVKFQKDLQEKGISSEETKNMKITIASDGTVQVDGIVNQGTAQKIEQLVEEKYADQFYRYYIRIADSVGNLSENTYQYAIDVQEVDRFLKKATNGQMEIEDLYLTKNCKIGGLPSNLDQYINETTNNAKAEELREAIHNVLEYQRMYGKENKPRFSASLQYQAGELSVMDGGFSMNVNDLASKIDGRFISDSMYGRTYEYNFRKVF